jgi:hypothetical protein
MVAYDGDSISGNRSFLDEELLLQWEAFEISDDEAAWAVGVEHRSK